MRKTAIVTGGSRGIGRAIAIALSHEYNVVINYCGSEDRANEVLAECACGTHREHHRPGAQRGKDP